MITIFNRLSVKEGTAGQIVQRFANSWGNVQGLPGFVSMQVLRSDYLPQLRTMEKYTGEDGPPLFTEMLRAKASRKVGSCGRERALSERLVNIGVTSQQRIAWSPHMVLDLVLAIGKGQS